MPFRTIIEHFRIKIAEAIRHITRPGLGLNCDDLLRIAAPPS